MCQGPMHSLLAALPKCETHMHLEGSLEPDLLFSLAEKNKIALPSSSEDPAFESVSTLLARYRRFTSLDDFLHYYFLAMSVLIQASDFEALAWAYFVRAKRDNVVHAEVFFDPQAHTARGVAYTTVLEGFTAARRRAETELGISTELIVCIMRHMPVSSAEELYHTALPDLRAGKISGLGLSSTEIGFPPSLFTSIYADAEAHGIRRTAHAGEEAPASYMASALDDLHVQRADHGIKLASDPALMTRFAREKIMLTVCPLSNVELRCVRSVAELPIRTFLDAGVPFSINSDDPAYFGGYILDNFCAVQEAFSLTVEEWAGIIVASTLGCWCSEQRKDEILKLLDEAVKQFT